MVAHKLGVLQRHCEDLARPYGEIERTALGTVHLEPGQTRVTDVIQQCHDFAEVGVQHMIFNMPNVGKIAPLEQFGRQIIPAVKEF